MEEIELTGRVGLDIFAAGRHYHPDFAISFPAVILARERGTMPHDKVTRSRALPETKLPR